MMMMMGKTEMVEEKAFTSVIPSTKKLTFIGQRL